MTKKPARRAAPIGPTRAVIYRRVSTERQGERVSPEMQLADCQAYAKAHGYLLLGVYSDVDRYRDAHNRLVEPSGTRTDRPDFNRMLADARAGQFDVIIAWREDRLYRGVKPAVPVGDLIEEMPVSVELVKETFDAKMLYFKAALGRMELQGIRERTMMGKLGRVQSGMHHGGRLPRGYLTVKDATGRTTGYTINPAWRAFFDDLAKLFLARNTYQQLADALGINPVTHHRWQSASIYSILANPWYRGKVEYGRNVRAKVDTLTFKGAAPAMWDAATCAAIERELARRAVLGPTAPRGADTLFSGIVRCGVCGRLMVTGFRQHQGKAGPVNYRYYACWRDVYVKKGLIDGPAHGPNYIFELKLMKKIKAAFATLTPADVDAFIAQATPPADAQPDPARETRLRAELDQVEARLADLTIGLEGVRNASAAATETILAELRRTGQAADRLREDLREVDRAHATGPDLEAARVEMLAFIADPARFNLPRAALRQALARALPALYVRGGELVERVAEWA